MTTPTSPAVTQLPSAAVSLYLWDSLPEKGAADRQMLCKRAREICYALSLSLEAVR